MNSAAVGSPHLIKLIWKIIFLSINNVSQCKPGSFLYTYATCLFNRAHGAGLETAQPTVSCLSFFLCTQKILYMNLIVLHDKSWQTKCILFSGKTGKILVPVSRRTEKSSVAFWVGMEECGVRRIGCYSLCLFPGPDCDSVQVYLWSDVSFLSSPIWNNTGLHGSLVLLIRHFPYCQRNLGDVAQLSMGRGKGDPRLLELLPLWWRILLEKSGQINFQITHLSNSASLSDHFNDENDCILHDYELNGICFVI